MALPLVSPRVIVPDPLFPKALALVEPVTVPACIVKPPVNVLAPERVSVPVSSLVSDPLVVEIIPVISVSPVPPMVRL